jgi:hypothetical protein
MLTMNADAHPLMRWMHKPDPKLPPDQQDKRSVIPIEAKDVGQWLRSTLDEARALLRLAPVDAFEAGPAPSAATDTSEGLRSKKIPGEPRPLLVSPASTRLPPYTSPSLQAAPKRSPAGEPLIGPCSAQAAAAPCTQ